MTSPEKKWAPVAIEIFYKYAMHNIKIVEKVYIRCKVKYFSPIG